MAVLIVLAVLLVTGGGDDDADDGVDPAKAGGAVDAVITRAVDGDTVEARVDGHTEDVRYIGVDTPESVKPDTPVQCYALAASHFNEDLVEGERVRLEFDAERRDVYGRLLAYVRLDGRFVNAELVRRGYARTLTIPPNTRYADLFARLEREASADGRGLWGECGDRAG